MKPPTHPRRVRRKKHLDGTWTKEGIALVQEKLPMHKNRRVVRGRLPREVEEHVKRVAELQREQFDTAATPQVDVERIKEYHFRRGLVTAIECILRELR